MDFETEHEQVVREFLDDIQRQLRRIESKVDTVNTRVQLMASSNLDDILDQVGDDTETKRITKDILNGTYEAKEIGD